MALAAAGAACVVRATGTVIRRERARGGAEAVALAFVVHGPPVASEVARILAAEIVSTHDDGTHVDVVVRLAGTRASATARRAHGTAGAGQVTTLSP